MNTNHHIIAGAVAALAAGTAIIATPTALGAQTPGSWDPCPAIDTEPICDIVHPRNQPGSDGTAVTNRPKSTAEPIDILDYNCDEWRNPVIACPGLDDTAEVDNLNQSPTDWVDFLDGRCRRVPWPDIVFCPY